MDVQFARQAQDVYQALQGPALALVAWIGFRVHQIEHGTQAAGGYPHLVELLIVFDPVVLVEQLLEVRQADLEGPMEKDRQFGWVHPMILGAVSKEPVLFWLFRYGPRMTGSPPVPHGDSRATT
jgi:hypothetical protein